MKSLRDRVGGSLFLEVTAVVGATYSAWLLYAHLVLRANRKESDSDESVTVGQAVYGTPSLKGFISEAVAGVKLSDFLSDLPPFQSLRADYEKKARQMNISDEWFVFLGKCYKQKGHSSLEGGE